MKEKLFATFGCLGGILWYVLSSLVTVLPFVMIAESWWACVLLATIAWFIPASSVVFWVWGLVCAIQGVQDAWAISYYVLFVVMFLPFFVCTVIDIFRKR